MESMLTEVQATAPKGQVLDMRCTAGFYTDCSLECPLQTRVESIFFQQSGTG